MKVANIGLYNCPHFGRLTLVMQTVAETRIIVVQVVVVVVVCVCV